MSGRRKIRVLCIGRERIFLMERRKVIRRVISKIHELNKLCDR